MSSGPALATGRSVYWFRFCKPATTGGNVRGINAKGAGTELTRKEIDALAGFVAPFGARYSAAAANV